VRREEEEVGSGETVGVNMDYFFVIFKPDNIRRICQRLMLLI